MKVAANHWNEGQVVSCVGGGGGGGEGSEAGEIGYSLHS